YPSRPERNVHATRYPRRVGMGGCRIRSLNFDIVFECKRVAGGGKGSTGKESDDGQRPVPLQPGKGLLQHPLRFLSQRRPVGTGAAQPWIDRYRQEDVEG